MINQMKQDAQRRMEKAVESFKQELGKIRTGRASASLLDHVYVDYYGTQTPLSQVANITVTDARTLTVTPWEKPMSSVIEKAILNSDLGLNPANLGASLRVPMPPLSEERRKEMIRVVRAEAEQGKVAIRNIRRDVNHQLKENVKDKSMTEDDERKAMDIIQKLTDQYIADIDLVLEAKEKDLMEI